MKRLSRLFVALAALAALTAIVAGSAFGGNGAMVTNTCPNVTGNDPATGLPGCQFNYFDGNGSMNLYTPASFHDVITPSGVENESFQGTIANDTGQVVTYSATSGAPVSAGTDSCYSFVTHKFTKDWQMTIQPSGAYSLDCHFAK